jgi:hypothetical protein
MMVVSGTIYHSPEIAGPVTSRRDARARRSERSHAINEEARDHARSLKGSPEFEQSNDERKKVEMRFAHLKVHHRFERMRCRLITSCKNRITVNAARPAPRIATRT